MQQQEQQKKPQPQRQRNALCSEQVASVAAVVHLKHNSSSGSNNKATVVHKMQTQLQPLAASPRLPSCDA
jgi:hypothetical protein